MPTYATLVNLTVGQQPPAAADTTTRWLSQSHQHMRIPMGPADRKPILGTGDGLLNLAAQEMNCWWNPNLQRYEATVNIEQAQYFTYAPSPLGPWEKPVKVLGTGTGGEALNCQQCTTYIEGGFIYFLYAQANTPASLRMARSPMPTQASPALSFTQLGVGLTSGVAGGTLSSCRIVKANGYYYCFTETNGSGVGLYMSTAQTPEDLISVLPFQVVVQQLTAGFRVPSGPRALKSYGRPWPILEADGTWVLYGHSTSPLLGQGGAVQRWVCRDGGLIPTNWTLDDQAPFLDRQTALEIDQIADFQALLGPNDKWFAFWTGLNNNTFATVNIMAAPMIEPMMSFDGSRWSPVMQQSQPLVEVGYVQTDMIGGGEYVAASAREEVWNEQAANAGGAYRLPAASQGSAAKVSNAGLRGANVLKIRATGTDTINGGNPITAATSASNTVTITTRRKHGLTTADFVTVTGFTPSGYNVNSAAVASVVDDFSFTYVGTAGSAAATVLGVFEWGLLPGETRRYKSRVLGNWIRD